MVTPRKHAKRKTCTDNISNDISTKNRHALLTNQTDNVDFSTQNVTEKGATHSICHVDEVETIETIKQFSQKKSLKKLKKFSVIEKIISDSIRKTL